MNCSTLLIWLLLNVSKNICIYFILICLVVAMKMNGAYHLFLLIPKLVIQYIGFLLLSESLSVSLSSPPPKVIAVGYAIMTTRSLDLNWQMRALRVLPMFLLPPLCFITYSVLRSFTKMRKYFSAHCNGSLVSMFIFSFCWSFLP